MCGLPLGQDSLARSVWLLTAVLRLCMCLWMAVRFVVGFNSPEEGNGRFGNFFGVILIVLVFFILITLYFNFLF
jgi:uncharacterized membrane protein